MNLLDTLLNERVNLEGKEELRLGKGNVVVKEKLEIFCEIAEDVGGKSPHIHRNDGVGSKLCGNVSVIVIVFAVLNFGAFGNVYKIAVFIHGADTAGNGAVFGKGVFKLEANHTVFVFVLAL